MRWLHRRRPATGDDGTGLAGASEAQALRLELAQRDEAVHRLEVDLRRARDQAAEQLAGRSRAERERFWAALATPLSQLATQAQLPEADPSSVLAVARSLLRHLEEEGLELLGPVGETVAYDPAHHEPLGDTTPAPGEAVVVRLVGVGVAGVVLRRAGVEPAGEGA